MTLEELLTDRDSFASVLMKLKAHQLTKHPGFRFADKRDITQELALEVCRKFARFDEKRGTLNAFLARVIENRATSMIREQETEKRDWRRAGPSLEKFVRDTDGRYVPFGETLDLSDARRHRGVDASRNAHDLAVDTQHALESVSDELRPLVARLAEMTEHAACRSLGLSRRQVASDMEELRAIFDREKLRDYLPQSGQEKSAARTSTREGHESRKENSQ